MPISDLKTQEMTLSQESILSDHPVPLEPQASVTRIIGKQSNSVLPGRIRACTTMERESQSSSSPTMGELAGRTYNILRLKKMILTTFRDKLIHQLEKLDKIPTLRDFLEVKNDS